MNDRKAPQDAAAAPSHCWLLPDDFDYDPARLFSKVIVAGPPDRYSPAPEGEILVPAFHGAIPRRRMRKPNKRLELWTNFFMGCQSGLPCDIGVVQEYPATSALEFAQMVAGAGLKDLEKFGAREAAYVLARIAWFQPTTIVGTEYTNRVGIAARQRELSVHRMRL